MSFLNCRRMSLKCCRPSFSRQKSNRLYPSTYRALSPLLACKNWIRFFFSLMSNTSLKASKYSLNSPQRKHHSRYYVAPRFFGCMLYMLKDYAPLENPEVCLRSNIFICWIRFKIVKICCRIFLALAAVIVA